MMMIKHILKHVACKYVGADYKQNSLHHNSVKCWKPLRFSTCNRYAMLWSYPLTEVTCRNKWQRHYLPCYKTLYHQSDSVIQKGKKKNRNNVASKLDIILFMLLRHINKMFVHCLISNTLLPTFVSVKVNLYGGISTRIKDLSGVDLDNRHVVGPWDETEKLNLLLSGYKCTVACTISGLRQKNEKNKNVSQSKKPFFLLTTAAPLLHSFLLGAYSQKYLDLAASLGMLTGMLPS